MSIQSPAGTLDIKNATLRVGKLEVSNIQGIDTALNVTRANSVLIYDDQVSTTTFNGTTSSGSVRDTVNEYLDLAGGYVYWGQKLPNSWVMDFEMDIRSGTNAGPLYANVFSTTNTGGDGYSFTFNDSNDKISLYYDSTLLTETTVSGLFTASEDWQKVVINYERGLIAISLDGSRKFYYKDIERETPYVNGEYVSFSSASTDERKIRDLRIVNGEKWVCSGESNVVYTQGSVGIGTSAPGYTLDVVGDIYASGNITELSDIRKKKNLEIIERPIKKLKELNGYTYEMDDKRYTGLVAQEVLKVLPEAVVGDEEKGYGLAYGNMAGLFVEAMKEMNEQLQSEKVRNDTLEARIAALENA